VAAGPVRVRQVRACTLTGNLPSRRVLEKAAFSYTGVEDGEAVYERDAPAS
jgi:RimJ/RimL family protein N-acetyltransferase